MGGGELRQWTRTAVFLATTVVLLSAAVPDPDELHPDPRLHGVGIGMQHSSWSMAKFEDEVRRHPQSAISHLERGNALMLDGDSDNAMLDFNRAIELDGRCTRAYFGRYFVYCGQRQYAKALAQLKKAYEIGPHDLSIDALNLQAALHKELGQFPEAFGEYTRVIDSKLFSQRRLSYVYLQRGIVSDRLGKVAAAIADYTCAAKMDPTLGSATLYRGNDYRGMKDYKRALADYGHLLAPAKIAGADEHSDYGAALKKATYRDRAILYSNMGRPDLAKADRMAAYQCDREDMDLMPFRDK